MAAGMGGGVPAGMGTGVATGMGAGVATPVAALTPEPGAGVVSGGLPAAALASPVRITRMLRPSLRRTATTASVATPSALTDRWGRRFPDPVLAFASGWMSVRARARQRGVELPLVISDHADWDELTAPVDEVRPGELWVTHGREEALARWAQLHGIEARALALVGYEDEAED